MAGYWLKLYTEILDDPKYYRISDNAKIGMYELMLVAKKVGNDGDLPTLDDICFYTRRDEAWWIQVIDELKRINFVTIDEDGGDIIRKFGERQAAIPSDERQKKFRESLHKKEFTCDVPVTEVSRNVTESKSKRKIKSTEVEKEIEGAPSPTQQIIESVIGISPANQSDLKALDEIEMLHPTLPDIQAAYSWLSEQGKHVKYYSSLVGPIRTAMAKRVQKPMSTPLDRSKAAVMQVLAELEAE